MLNAFTKFYKTEKKQREIVLNTLSWPLTIWDPAIETWAQEIYASFISPEASSKNKQTRKNKQKINT